MVVDRYFLIIEYEVQIKKILYCDERTWIDHTMPSQERFELSVRQIGFKVGVILHNSKVLLRVVELVNVVFQLPVRELLP